MPEQQNNTQQNTAPQAPSNQHNYDENVIKIILSALAKLKEAFRARKRKKYDYYATPFEEKVEQLEKQLNNLDEQDAVFCDCLRDVAETLEKISGSIVGGELKGITPDEFFDLFNEIEKNLSNTSNKFILSDKKVETVLKETFGNDVLDKVYKKDEKDQRLLTDNVKFYMAKSGDRADLYMMIGENAVKISKIQKDNDNEVLFLDKTKLYEKDGKVYLNNPENSMPLEQLHLAPNLTIEKAIGKAMFRCEKDYLDARKAKGENIRSQAAEITGTESSPFKKDTLRCFVDDKGYYIKDEKENGLRAILNLGHTYGHALEKCSNYSVFTHGEAVAVGLQVCFDLSLAMNLIEDEYYDRATDLIKKFEFNLPEHEYFAPEKLIDAMKFDKKVEAGKIRFVLPTAVGEVQIFDNVDRKILSEILK